MAFAWGKTVADLDEPARAAEAGFDVAELPVGLLTDLNDAEFREQSRALGQTGLSFPAWSGLLPPGVQVTGQGFNIYVWSEYLKKALERVAALGGRMVAWSDGRSRVLPVEGETGGAKRQALQFLFMVSEIAQAHGITVLVEPLDPRRTNFLNSIAEVREFLDLAGKPNLSSAISLRDREAIGLEYTDFGRHADLISHVYLEDPSSPAGPRRCPRPDDGFDYRPFLDAIRGISYSGTICLPENADVASLSFCRSIVTD